jgi:hypothetical protein
MACGCDSSYSPKRGKEGFLNNEGRLESVGNKPIVFGDNELVDVERERQDGARY